MKDSFKQAFRTVFFQETPEEGKKKNPQTKTHIRSKQPDCSIKKLSKLQSWSQSQKVLLLIAVKLLKQYMKVFRDTQYNFVQESITRIKNKTTTSSSQEQSGYLFSGDITGL